MDKSGKPISSSGETSQGTQRGNWAIPADDNHNGANGGTRSQSTRQVSAVTSGSPIPARRPDVSATQESLGIPPKVTAQTHQTSESKMSSKAVAGIVAAAVVLTLGIVVLLYLMTQGSEDPRPVAEDRTVAPPSAEPPTGNQGAARAVALKGFSVLLPAGWNYEETQGGYTMGPASNPSLVRIYINYRGTSLSSLRPKCEAEKNPETSESTDPDSTSDPSESPTTRTPTPSPTTTPEYSNISEGNITLIANERADSEAGSYECDSGEAQDFNSIIVPSKKFAMTFGSMTSEISGLIESIIFE